MTVTAPAVPVAGVVINVGSAEGRAGETVSIEVTVDTEGDDVGGIQNDIGFEAQASIAVDEFGRPICRVAPLLGIIAATFALLPPGCERDLDCELVRALVLDLRNLPQSPDGLVYTCDVAIAPGAPPGQYLLMNSNTQAADPDWNPLPTTGTDGVVVVVPCTGDCNTDGQVTVDELVLAIVIAQEQAAIGACPAIDSNDDGRAGITEVVSTLNNLLTGCVR